MALVQGRLSGRAINGTITSRQRADVSVRLCPWGRDAPQAPAVSLRISGGWLPSDASPIGWWRADIERTPQFWGDISGNGMDGVQLNGSDWESTSSTAINGRECARFQATAGAFGAYDFLAVYTAGQISNTDGVTFVVVYKLSTALPSNSYVTPLTIAEGLGGKYGGLRITNESGFKSTSIVAWTYGADASVGYGSALDTNGHAVVAYGDAVDVDNPTSYDATDNGTTQTIAASSAYTAPAVGLGYLDTGLLSSCTQVLDVAEAIVFRGALSAGNIASLDAYLFDLYALAGAADVPIDGAATCATVASGTIAADHPIAGAATAATAAAGAIAADHPIAGAATCSTVATGDVAADHPIAGAGTATASASGDIAADHPIDGAASAVTSSTADVAALHPIDGTASAVAVAAGDLAAEHPIAGAAVCVTVAAGDLGVAVEISGAATCAAVAAGDLAALHPIAGEATAATLAAGDLGQNQPIAGAATASTTAAGDIAAEHPIGGSSSCVTSSAADIAADHPIDGSATCRTEASGDVGIGLSIAGAATCRTSSTGRLSVTGPIVVASLSVVVPTAARLSSTAPSAACVAATTPGAVGASAAAPTLVAANAAVPTAARLRS